MLNNNLENRGLFILWEDALPCENEILKILHDRFTDICIERLAWSSEAVDKNINRLYRTPNILKHKTESPHRSKVKTGKFLVIEYRDNAPIYRYAPSVSGAIELCNLNSLKVKANLREIVRSKYGQLYAVHGTNNVEEYIEQKLLLFGDLDYSLGSLGPKSNDTYKRSMLLAENGWDNWSTFFLFLNKVANYVVLRGFESLPQSNAGGDLDILVEDYQKVASFLGVVQLKEQLYKGFVTIEGKSISMDIRFVGDNYYDTLFQRNILEGRVDYNGLFVPNQDDYFFSLLFHCRVQKLKVKVEYIEILLRIAADRGFYWFDQTILSSDKRSGQIIEGFYRGNGYKFSLPIDKHVVINQRVTRYLGHGEIWTIKVMNSLKYILKALIPKWLLTIYRKYR